MSLRDALRKAAGLLVELPPEEAQPAPAGEPNADLDKIFDSFAQAQGAIEGSTKTVEQIVKESDGPNLGEITVPASEIGAALTDAGDVDFAAIYAQTGLPSVPFSAEQMLDMLSSLPSELPLETKRQTVNVTLGTMGKTLGLTSEAVVADASRKLSALGAFVETLNRQTADMVSETEAEIQALQAQIEEKKRAIQSAKLKQTRVAQSCDAESQRLDDVLEFFSLDVPPSRYASENRTQ